jgi:hypothetical protein
MLTHMHTLTNSYGNKHALYSVMWGNTYTRRRRLRDVRRAAERAQSLAKGAGAVSG